MQTQTYDELPEEIIPNFQAIETVDELPKGMGCFVNIFVKSCFEAQQYAMSNPSRQVYWLEDRLEGIWYTPLRRSTDNLRWKEVTA